MPELPLNLLLADDDKDDCLLFKEALDELSLPVNLTTVNDGEQLMQLLFDNTHQLPSVIFLDLNMPRKNGFECLIEIKLDDTLKKLPVIIYSTSLDPNMAKALYSNGAQHYIRKPAEFSKIKEVINQALSLTAELLPAQPSKEKFILDI